MRDFQDTFETRKRSFRSAFSTCMNVLLIRYNELNLNNNIFKMLSVAKLNGAKYVSKLPKISLV